LPKHIEKKTEKQLVLGTKIKGRERIWETRIDLYYRLTFEIIEDTLFLRVTGSHDEVLRTP
jgi:hypothetical protein